MRNLFFVFCNGRNLRAVYGIQFTGNNDFTFRAASRSAYPVNVFGVRVEHIYAEQRISAAVHLVTYVYAEFLICAKPRTI